MYKCVITKNNTLNNENYVSVKWSIHQKKMLVSNDLIISIVNAIVPT